MIEGTRRDVLKLAGLSALGAAGAGMLPWGATLGAKAVDALPASRMPQPFRAAFVRPPVLRPRRSVRDRDGMWVDQFEVTMRRGRAGIVPGLTTTVFGYNGIAPGPTLNIRQGRRSELRVRNKLPGQNPVGGDSFSTSVHLHGSASLPQYDGYASDITPPGFEKTYQYPNFQPARTLWYHDHGAHHTAENVYAGLYAQYHMHDAAESALLPQGEFDVPLTIGDVMLAADGSVRYDDNSFSGLWGDIILVNGRPWPLMKVKRRVYRFRVLTATLSRSFRFRLSTGDPVTVVATDGGLMPRSRQVVEWRQAGAERYEVLIDFSKYRPGQRIVLQNLSNLNNVDHRNTDKVMAFEVTDAPFSKRDHTWRRIPDALVNSHVMDLKPSDATRTRRLVVERKNGSWTINGHTWDEVIRSNFELLVANPKLGATEIWDIVNPSGGWFHPVHIHLIDFKVLSRNGRPPFDHELGPKDVVYAGENETVRLIMKFGPHRGRYMVHCHNLPHEDNDMMSQFAVGWRPGQPDPNHPVEADPPVLDRRA